MNAEKLIRWAPWVLVCAGGLAYVNSLTGAFILDDIPWIVRNPRIQHLWPPWESFSGTSRPLVQWSFALNFALGAHRVWGYHAVNVLIHILTGLVLWGIVCRAMPMILDTTASRVQAQLCGLVAVLLWTVHPLQTESVTYVVQRAESMMGMFACLTIYCMWRGAESAKRPWVWYAGAVAASWLAAFSKMTMVTLPLVALLVDRAYLSGSMVEAWRRRKWLYIGLAGSWVVLGWLVAVSGREWGETAGFSVSGVSVADYAWTQPEVILRYVRLSLWPSGLCLLYDWPFQRDTFLVLMAMTGVMGLLILAIWLNRRHATYGVWLAWFFLFLAPTSTVVPLLHPIFEHRMYLPLAGLLVPLVASVYVCSTRLRIPQLTVQGLRWAGGVLAVVFLASVTIARNADYRTEVSIWEDTVSKSTNNARAHLALGLAYETAGDSDAAVVEFERAATLRPGWADPQHAWAQLLYRAKDLGGARQHFLQALAADPGHAASYHDLGVIESQHGNYELAERYLERAVQLKPDWMQAHANLRNVRDKRRQESIFPR